MKIVKKIFVLCLKQLDLGSAAAVRLTKLTGKSKVPIHPKHFLTLIPWFTKYIEKSDIVLDLGCGNGQNSIKAARYAQKVIGVDIDESLLAIAQKSTQAKNIDFLKLDLEEKLPFKNSSFDKILFLDVLEHLEKRDQTLQEVKRILASSGLLFLGVPNSQTSWKRFQRSAGICSYSDPDHKLEFSENSIRLILKKHKFKILHFGYGKLDIPARGLIDIIGGFSLTLYKFVSRKREQLAQEHPREASGFEIVAQKL